MTMTGGPSAIVDRSEWWRTDSLAFQTMHDTTLATGVQPDAYE